jgi:hypothetical protein
VAFGIVLVQGLLYLCSLIELRVVLVVSYLRLLPSYSYSKSTSLRVALD